MRLTTSRLHALRQLRKELGESPMIGMKGTVVLELIDVEGPRKGRRHVKTINNVITNTFRNRLAQWIAGTAITPPTHIGVGTGTNTPTFSDTALQTKLLFDAVNDNKAATKVVQSLYATRIIVNFTTAQANGTLREAGLFDGANSANLFSRVAINITKTSSQVLNIYWLITIERRISVAKKSGTSIAATGTITANTDSTLSLATPCTTVILTNLSGARCYWKLNGGTIVPTLGSEVFDGFCESGDAPQVLTSDEEIEVNSVHVYVNATTGVHVVGW